MYWGTQNLQFLQTLELVLIFLFITGTVLFCVTNKINIYIGRLFKDT